jgi:hypothetical protein
VLLSKRILRFGKDKSNTEIWKMENEKVDDGAAPDLDCPAHNAESDYDIEKWRLLSPFCGAGLCACATKRTKSRLSGGGK